MFKILYNIISKFEKGNKNWETDFTTNNLTVWVLAQATITQTKGTDKCLGLMNLKLKQ
jgi:hypothetical protein